MSGSQGRAKHCAKKLPLELTTVITLLSFFFFFPCSCRVPQDVLAGSVRSASWRQPSLHQPGQSLALGAVHLPSHGAGGCRRERVGGRTVRLHL